MEAALGSDTAAAFGVSLGGAFDLRVTISRDPPHPGASSADLLAPQDPIGPGPSDARS